MGNLTEELVSKSDKNPIGFLEKNLYLERI